MEPTVENAVAVALKAKASLVELEAYYGTSGRMKRLHAQLNTLALIAAHVHGQDFGGFGTLDDVDPVTGGTNKGINAPSG